MDVNVFELKCILFVCLLWDNIVQFVYLLDFNICLPRARLCSGTRGWIHFYKPLCSVLNCRGHACFWWFPLWQWDIRTGEVVQEYDRHLGAVNTITFVDDHRRFVSTSDDKSLRVWEWWAWNTDALFVWSALSVLLCAFCCSASKQSILYTSPRLNGE